jgi:hypothetical protein
MSTTVWWHEWCCISRIDRSAGLSGEHHERFDQFAPAVDRVTLDRPLQALEHALANGFGVPAEAARLFAGGRVGEPFHHLGDQLGRNRASRRVRQLGHHDQRRRQVELARLVCHFARIGEQLLVGAQQRIVQGAAHAAFAFIHRFLQLRRKRVPPAQHGQVSDLRVPTHRGKHRAVRHRAIRRVERRQEHRRGRVVAAACEGVESAFQRRGHGSPRSEWREIQC